MQYTKETMTVKNATLLIDGTIIVGSVFGSVFVAGDWGMVKGERIFKPAMFHPLRTMERLAEPFVFDVSDRAHDTMDDGFGFVQTVYRAARSEVR